MAFTKALPSILSEQDYFKLQDHLLETPDAGDIIPGSRGLRKIRVSDGRKGKRGAARVIYFWYVSPERIQFCRIYEKSSQTNLSKTEIQKILTELDP